MCSGGRVEQPAVAQCDAEPEHRRGRHQHRGDEDGDEVQQASQRLARQLARAQGRLPQSRKKIGITTTRLDRLKLSEVEDAMKRGCDVELSVLRRVDGRAGRSRRGDHVDPEARQWGLRPRRSHTTPIRGPRWDGERGGDVRQRGGPVHGVPRGSTTSHRTPSSRSVRTAAADLVSALSTGRGLPWRGDCRVRPSFGWRPDGENRLARRHRSTAWETVRLERARRRTLLIRQLGIQNPEHASRTRPRFALYCHGSVGPASESEMTITIEYCTV